MSKTNKKIYLYDTTLRDGGQTAYVDFTTQNKIDLSHQLDNLGVDYIEAGWYLVLILWIIIFLLNYLN